MPGTVGPPRDRPKPRDPLWRMQQIPPDLGQVLTSLRDIKTELIQLRCQIKEQTGAVAKAVDMCTAAIEILVHPVRVCTFDETMPEADKEHLKDVLRGCGCDQMIKEVQPCQP